MSSSDSDSDLSNNSSSGSGSDSNADSSSESEVEVKQKVKVKAKAKRKKPSGPKKPQTAFMFFAKGARSQIKARNPEADFAEIGRLLGRAWKSLSPTERAPFQTQNDTDKKRYLTELQAMDPALLTPANRKKLKTVKPKRPLSSYMFFSRDYRKIVQEENPEAKFADIGRLLGARWKNLGAEEKIPYIDKNAADKVRYKDEMVVHEAKEKAKQEAKAAEEAAKRAEEEEEQGDNEGDEPMSGNEKGADSSGSDSGSGSGSDSDSGSDSESD